MSDDALKSAYFTLMVAMGCAWASGISPWITALTLGLILRAQENLHPSGGLQFLMSPWILTPLALLSVVEVVADKWPRWDVRWNLRNGKFRIAGAVLLAWMAASAGGLPIDVRLIVAIFGGIAAFAVHAARTSVHIAMHGAGTQNFAVPLSGLVEELLLLSMLLPLSVGSPGLTTMMIGVTTMAVLLILFLTWSDAKRVMLDMVLGPEPPASRE